jgi:hypothetical protein
VKKREEGKDEKMPSICESNAVNNVCVSKTINNHNLCMPSCVCHLEIEH